MVRAGELLAVQQELYSWPFDEQSNAAARSTAHSSRKSEKDAKAALTGLVGSEIPRDQALLLGTQECGRILCKSTKPFHP